MNVSMCVLHLHLCVSKSVPIRQTLHNQLVHSMCVCAHVCIMTAISNTWWITHHHNLHNFEVFIALVRQLQ